MGTRNLTCVYMNGEYKVAQYGQWDGYPEGVGCDILRTLRNVNIENLKTAISKCRFLTDEELERIENDPVMKLVTIYPQTSRDIGGQILAMILLDQRDVLVNYIEFAKEGWCGWAYCVDFDKGKFEVFCGYNKEPLKKDERFYFDGYVNEHGYYPPRKVAEFDLNNLPTESEFINHFKSEDED